MRALTANGTLIHFHDTGPNDAPALVFSNSLGTDLRAWEPLLHHLPAGWRVIRYDKRGHGLSACPPRPWGMGDHVADLAGLLDHLGVSGAVVCGLSVGGLIAQGLAAERPDLVRAIILCDTAAKIGTDEIWDGRIAAVEQSGMEAVADATMQRWFTGKTLRDDPERVALWRNMVTRTPAEGYLGTMESIRDCDLRESTPRLRLPCMGVGGVEDDATPPDLVRETVEMIPGGKFHLLRGAGHIPQAEAPEQLGRLMTEFLAGL
ncbi:3-oxoadipate enol-lactonase [Limibaculum sp. M0105]|uniref:3-oxoadipate enol-lactonase n=1 Tax=Thermohalobaculum xanthum TaxID=2753746 RepID=A0A8J7M6C3_9RHOB|nr:3-oxoadipate enol-lactonase [Thermohalobaculum xanthum]MBK0398677.1 3-oxoadipate enol-lactonase [Thermohalobaculum xanthum]